MHNLTCICIKPHLPFTCPSFQSLQVSRADLEWIPVAGTAGNVVRVTSKGRRQAADSVVGVTSRCQRQAADNVERITSRVRQ
ncbi:hypothetical protein FKM82_021383 [Ascaphus truei]